jgi:hypothetical protein
MLYRDEIDNIVLGQYVARLNYRARQYNAVGTLSATDLRSLIMNCNGRCEWCQMSLVHSEFEIDHIISLSNGGINEIGNLAVSCLRCNRRKYENPPLQFALEFVAANGYKSPLVVRILALYGEVAYKQQSLFDDPIDATTAYSSGDGDEANDETEPPRYRW